MPQQAKTKQDGVINPNKLQFHSILTKLSFQEATSKIDACTTQTFIYTHAVIIVISSMPTMTFGPVC